jgi:4-carboxymuconolactone decarboxylase
MEDLHEAFSMFKEDFPDVYSAHESLGKLIHEEGGPLSEKVRWLIKIAVSAGSGHRVSLQTHIAKAWEAGVTDEEIKHVLLLTIQTAGFPSFMEAYTIYKGMPELKE